MAILRSVARTDTFEIQRQKINLIASDLYTVQTSVGAGAFSMSDGSVQAPSLFFTNANDVGIYRGSSGKTLYIGSEGNAVAAFSKDYLTSLQNFRTFRSPITSPDGITIASGGSGYNIGDYPKVKLTGGSGSGALASVITSVVGTLTNVGGGYVFGSYQNVPLTGGSGSGMLALVVVNSFTGIITSNGTGGTPGQYPGISLTGGSGSGLVATIDVSPLGGGTGVSGVTITTLGTGYVVGDIVSAPSGSIGNVTGFQYELTAVGDVDEITITDAGSGYNSGDVLSASNTDLGGSGAGLQFTVSDIGALSEISITDGGDNYVVGDVLTIDNSELAQIVTFHVKILDTQLFTFNPASLPSSGFNVGDTITYNGDQAVIVKRFTSGSNVEAITTEVQNFGFSNLIPGTQIDDGNGNVATPIQIDTALNYFFSSTGPTGTYVNIPDFTLQKNVRYIFDQTDSTNIGHPLRFSITRDGFHTVVVPVPTQYGEQYDGVEVDYNYAANLVSIVPSDDTPVTLYYYCGEGVVGGAAHIDEGGYNNREGVITVSGSVPLVGSGISLSVASIDQQSNIILNKNGTATFKATNVDSITSTGNGVFQSNLDLSGDFTINTDKFIVDGTTGDTVIDGGLSVAGELSFLADASFGATLYVDSINNKVSVNIDPLVTPLTKELEVSGSFSATGSSEIAIDDGATLKLGDPTVLAKTYRLQTDGSIYATDKFFASATGSITDPTYTFDGAPRIGISANSTSNSLSFVGTTGELLKLEPLVVTNYRNSNYDQLSVTDYSIVPAEGYVIGSYQGVQLEGGTGSGFIGNITIAFSLTETTAGSGYVDGTDFTCQFTTSGSGTGAQAIIAVQSGSVTSILITDGGSGYISGDTITIDPSTISDDQGEPVVSSPTLDAEYVIDKLGAVTVVDAVVSGEGYLQGDVLTLPQNSSLAQGQTLTYNIFFGSYAYALNDIVVVGDRLYEVTVAGTSGDDPPTHELGSFQNGDAEFTFLRFVKLRYTITDTSTTTTVNIDKDLGRVRSKSIETTGSGINVDNQTQISGSTISSLVDSDITIAPGSSQKLLSVSGTGGVKVPVGTSQNRPAASTLGVIRYNSETQQYEGSNGSDFISLGGVRDVDGNTYILAEKFVGANDNTLYFYTDDTNTARLTTGELTLITSNTIASRDIALPKVQWEAGASATAATLPLVNYVYYEDNLYSVDSSGTFDTDVNNAPTHTSGSVTNGTVDLTYVSSVFGPLTLKASTISLEATLTLSGLEIYSYNTNNLILDNSLTTTQFAFGKENGVPDTLLTLTDSGEVQINRQSGTANAADNLTIIDKTLKFIDIDDITIKTNTVSLIRGSSDIGSFSVYDPSVYNSAKVVVVADNTTTDDRHIVEYSVIDKGADLFVVEYADLNTGIELFTSTFDFAPGGDVRISTTLLDALTPGDVVNITVSFTTTKK